MTASTVRVTLSMERIIIIIIIILIIIIIIPVCGEDLLWRDLKHAGPCVNTADLEFNQK